MITVHEGQTFRTTSQDILYPDITSCVSITCVCKGPILAGGHAFMFPDPAQGQLTIDRIVDFVNVNTPPTERAHLFLIGETGTWDDNIRSLGSRFTSMNDIANVFGCPHTVVDVFQYSHGRAAVQIYFSPLGFYEIRPNHGGTVYKRGAW
jgi:hypothetical protein